MKMFWERSEEEREIIRKAYEFEMEAIKSIPNGGGTERNPYLEIMRNLPDGAELDEALDDAIEMAIYGIREEE